MKPLQFLWNMLRGKADLTEELESHLRMAVADRVARGESPDYARKEALREFGNVPLIADVTRERCGWLRLEHWVQDLRYAFRTLRRDRGFTTVAVLMLALGIGSNIVVFSVVNTILLRPLPFKDSQRLVWLEGNNGAGGLSDRTYRVDAYEEFQRNNHSFQEVTAFVPDYSLWEAALMGNGQPKPVSSVWVAGNFFQTLGVRPVLGRLFTPEECVAGGRRAVLLSYPFWQRQFGADPTIVGQAIRLNNDSVTVVGVLPATFDFGAVFAPGSKMDTFRPVYMNDIRNWGHMVSLVGRLKPGVTVAQAQAESTILFPQLKDAGNPDWGSDVKTTMTSLKDHVNGKLRRSLIVLWSAVGLILLIVCVNLSNLMLARTAARSKEMALRSALGSGRMRLIQQLMTESLVLSSTGAMLGLVFAYAALHGLAQSKNLALPLLSSITMSGSAVVWTILVTAITALMIGLAPALKMSGPNLLEALNGISRGASDGKKHGSLRSTLVILEVALSCALLVGAGLLLRSFLQVLDVDMGFQPSHAAALKIDSDDGGNAAKRGAVLQDILQRVGGIPGIESAGVSDMLPLDRNRSWNLVAKGKVYSKETNYDAFVYLVSPGYLHAMGMHLREGRDFSWQDGPNSEKVIIINEAAARREWPGENPIGRLAQGIGYSDTRVVGVISDVRESSLELASSPEVLVPITQGDPQGAELVVRTKLPPEVLASSVMSTLRSINPGQPATEFRPLQQLVERAVSPRRFFVLLVAAFAVLGLIIASLGIYGVISYSVTQRTQEIGIRMSLGATTGRVQRDVLGKTMRLALLGVALGAMLSLAVARLIASLLFATAPTDPATFAGVMLLLCAVAVLAGYIPARRASRIDPVIALRSNG